MVADYHIHTALCGHAWGGMEEYVQSALVKGFKEMGFADHLPMYFRPVEERDPSIAMGEEELPGYIEKIKQLQKDFPGITIRLGIEADYIPGFEETLKGILDLYPFDYVYGSIHFLDGWGFDDSRFIDTYSKWDLKLLYERYFMALQDAAKSGIFDILAHPDLIKKFNFRPEKVPVELYEATVLIIKEADLAIEVNSAGLRYPAQEIYPSPEFLELCHHYQVPATLGSDAHSPEQVGAGFDQSLDLLRRIGYKELAVFQDRKRTLIPIP